MQTLSLEAASQALTADTARKLDEWVAADSACRTGLFYQTQGRIAVILTAKDRQVEWFKFVQGMTFAEFRTFYASLEAAGSLATQAARSIN